MSDIALQFDHVWKKFQMGEKFDSLRDLIPALTKSLLRRKSEEGLREKEFWALEDVSFSLKKGDALGIIGPNGAGKSTTLKILSRILRPNKGHMHVHGRLSALIEVGAGFHPDLTGRENIYLNAAILGMRKKETDSKLDEIVSFSGLEDFLDTPIKRYSSGMYARLGFSVASHIDPDILLVDEVLSVGDMKFQEKCINQMRKIVDNGVTIIFVSHNLESVQLLCPKTLYLRNGKVKSLSDTNSVIRDYVCSTENIESNTNQLAEIDRVMLCNANGDHVVSLSPGEHAALRFLVKCSLPLDQCLIGFIIHRATDGLPICDYNLSLGEYQQNMERQGEQIPMTLKFNANLLRGTYTVSLHVYHYGKAEFLCTVKNIITFSIEERISWIGVAHMEPILSLDRNS